MVVVGVSGLSKTLAANRKVKHLVSRFLRDESAVTTIEYGLIVAILGTIIMVAFGAIGETMRDDIFGAVADTLNGVLETGGGDGGGTE